jgi:secreted trypsin-like serine protease
VLATLSFAAPAPATTNATADGHGHPSVGGLVSPTRYSDGSWIYCSATLISPTVFLTAAHCAEDGERVQVTFDPA